MARAQKLESEQPRIRREVLPLLLSDSTGGYSLDRFEPPYFLGFLTFFA